MLIFHVLLLALTLAAIPARLKAPSIHGHKNPSVIDVLIRDGIWAFVVILGELKIRWCLVVGEFTSAQVF